MQQSTLHPSGHFCFSLSALWCADARCVSWWPFNVTSDSKDHIAACPHLAWKSLLRIWCGCIYENIKKCGILISVWAWLLPHVALKTRLQLQFLPLNTSMLQTETLKCYWNDTCNRSLTLCAWLGSLERHLPAVSLSCCVFFLIYLIWSSHTDAAVLTVMMERRALL